MAAVVEKVVGRPGAVVGSRVTGTGVVEGWLVVGAGVDVNVVD